MPRIAVRFVSKTRVIEDCWSFFFNF